MLSPRPGRIARVQPARTAMDRDIDRAFGIPLDEIVHSPSYGYASPAMPTLVNGVTPAVQLAGAGLALGAGAGAVGYLTDEERPWMRGY